MDTPPYFLPTLIILFFFTFIFIYTFRRKTSSSNLPPSPPWFPVIGNLHQVLGNDIHRILHNLSEKFGPLMLLHLGTQPFLVISSTEMATQVLKTHDHDMCTRPVSRGSNRLSFNYMDVAFSPHSDHWREMRKVLVSEFLGAKRSKIFKNIMEIEIEGLVRFLSNLPANTVVNLDDKLLHMVNDVVCKVTFGKRYRDKMFNGRTMKEIVDETVVMLSGSFSDIFPTFGWILNRLSGWDRRLDKCFNDIDGFLQMILDDHLDQNKRKGSDHENDFIDDCISRLTNDEIKGLLLNVLNGAIDTSAIAMVWAMSETIKNPRIMQKLQSEIRRCVGRKARVDESDISKMTYLKMVVKETLRLHPPAPFLVTRECINQGQIGGYDVFPGTKVMVNSWAIGRDPRIWEERPTEFYPERFEKIQVDFGGKNLEMVPFGGGRRVCPGYNSAISTIEFTIANLLYLFNWETGKKGNLDMEEEGFQLIRRKTPLCLVPIKYNWQEQ